MAGKECTGRTAATDINVNTGVNAAMATANQASAVLAQARIGYDRSRCNGYLAFVIGICVTARACLVVMNAQNAHMNGNESAFGLALASLPAQRASVEAAGDSGEIVVAGRTLLVQDAGGRPGFVARAAIYRPSMPTGSVPERRAAFAGVVTIAFRVDDLMREVIEPTLLAHMALQIIDTGDAKAGVALPAGPVDTLFDRHRGATRTLSRLAAQGHIEVAQRHWLLKYRALAGSRCARDITPLVLIAAAGIVISFLIAALLLASHRSRTLARRLRATLDAQRASLAELERQKSQIELAHGAGRHGHRVRETIRRRRHQALGARSAHGRNPAGVRHHGRLAEPGSQADHVVQAGVGRPDQRPAALFRPRRGGARHRHHLRRPAAPRQLRRRGRRAFDTAARFVSGQVGAGAVEPDQQRADACVRRACRTEDRDQCARDRARATDAPFQRRRRRHDAKNAAPGVRSVLHHQAGTGRFGAGNEHRLQRRQRHARRQYRDRLDAAAPAA